MSGKAGRSGRPTSSESKTRAVQIRLSEEEEGDLAAVVARRSKIAGAALSGPAVIRWLISREARSIIGKALE